LKVTHFLFVLLGVIWGSNFILMKMAASYITPLQVVFVRVVSGLLPIMLYAFYKKQLRLEHIRYLHCFFVMSILATSLYFYGFVKGTELLNSGVAGGVSGSIPLFSFIAAAIFLKDEKVGLVKLSACLLALIGIVLIAKPFSGKVDNNLLHGIIFMALGSLSLGLSFVYAKKFVTPLSIGNTALVTYQLTIAAIILCFLTDFSGITNIQNNHSVLMGTVVGLGIIGTGMAYVIYYYIVDGLGAVTASTVTYLPPIVALIIGVLIVGEEIVASDYVGTLFIFLGIFVLNREKYTQSFHQRH